MGNLNVIQITCGFKCLSFVVIMQTVGKTAISNVTWLG